MAREKSVLIVEDDALISIYLEAIAKDAGHSVITARSSYEATALLASVDVDLVLLDLVLDGRPCLPLARRLAAGGVRVILCTATDVHGLPAELTGVQVITKPFDPGEVQSILERAIDGARDAPAALLPR